MNPSRGSPLTARDACCQGTRGRRRPDRGGQSVDEALFGGGDFAQEEPEFCFGVLP